MNRYEQALDEIGDWTAEQKAHLLARFLQEEATMDPYLFQAFEDWLEHQAEQNEGEYDKLTPEQKAKIKEVYLEVQAAQDGDHTLTPEQAEQLYGKTPLHEMMGTLMDAMFPNKLVERLGFDPDEHPKWDEAAEALADTGEYEYKGQTIRPAPGDGYTLTGFDRYDTLTEALEQVDAEEKENG